MKYLTIGFCIFLTLAASRFVPHPPNFTSLLALSFYVPALLGIRYLPFLVISFVLTDILLAFTLQLCLLGKCYFNWFDVKIFY